MPHLSKRELDTGVNMQIHEMLDVVLGNLNKKEINLFLSSLLTDTEKAMLAKRLACAIMLKENIDYKKVSNLLKITFTTVYRTHLIIQAKPVGFELAAKKIGMDNALKQIKAGLLKLAGYAIRASGGYVKPEIF